jgi:hypothetical protein
MSVLFSASLSGGYPSKDANAHMSMIVPLSGAYLEKGAGKGHNLPDIARDRVPLLWHIHHSCLGDFLVGVQAHTLVDLFHIILCAP